MPTTIDSQLMSLGKLLTGDDCCYCVPIFQRDYSWTETEVNQLWTDITNTIDEGCSEHFMSAIVVNSSKKPYPLIDGQ